VLFGDDSVVGIWIEGDVWVLLGVVAGAWVDGSVFSV
jgi:hypothetical protein